MKPAMFAAFLASLVCSAVTLLAQPAPGGGADHPDGPPPPPPQRDGQYEGGPQQGGPPREGPGGGMMMPGQRGPQQAGQPRPGGPGVLLPPEMQATSNYLTLVEQFAKLSKDSSATGVAAVISASDVLRKRGNDAAIAYFNDLLPKAKDPTVQRAIRLQLIELYRRANQGDKALEQAQALITAAP